MPDIILAIDQGTTGTTVVLLDRELVVKGHGYRIHDRGLGGNQFHREARGDNHLGDRLFRTQRGAGRPVLPVRDRVLGGEWYAADEHQGKPERGRGDSGSEILAHGRDFRGWFVGGRGG